MAMKWKVLTTAPAYLIRPGGAAVRGYEIQFIILDTNEQLSVQVETLEAGKVKAEIEKLVKQREALAEMGSSA